MRHGTLPLAPLSRGTGGTPAAHSASADAARMDASATECAVARVEAERRLLLTRLMCVQWLCRVLLMLRKSCGRCVLEYGRLNTRPAPLSASPTQQAVDFFECHGCDARSRTRRQRVHTGQPMRAPFRP